MEPQYDYNTCTELIRLSCLKIVMGKNQKVASGLQRNFFVLRVMHKARHLQIQMEQTAIKEKAQRAELLRQAARGSVPLTPAPEKLDADIDFYASADLYDDDDDDDDLQKPPLEFTVTDCADEDFTDEDYEPLAFGCEAVEELDRDADRDTSEKQSDRKRKTELEAASPINNKTPRGAVDQLVAQLPK